MKCVSSTFVAGMMMVASVLLGARVALALASASSPSFPTPRSTRFWSRRSCSPLASPTTTATNCNRLLLEHTVQRHLGSPSSLSVIPLRGGAVQETLRRTGSWLSQWNSTPQNLFNANLCLLAVATMGAKILQQRQQKQTESADVQPKVKPAAVTALQRRFLAVFWLLRCADWLQGPYFYEVYATKTFPAGDTATMSWVSRLFLTGFASTALFGPVVGRAADAYGRKKATLAFSIIYSIGAWSTKSTTLTLLFAGRVLSGIGTSLLFSAPESWLVGAAAQDNVMSYLGETFGMAYAGDAIVAILAGQMAGWAAGRRGPTGPFECSCGFLLLGGLLASFLWKENKATTMPPTSGEAKDDGNADEASTSTQTQVSIKEALQVVWADPKIMLIGAVQSLFEAAMYIFVLQWPPAISRAIAGAFETTSTTPYGTIFSCYMACCLLGSTLFSQLTKMNVPTENFTTAMLSVATLSMVGATLTCSGGATAGSLLWTVTAAFFVFEACVGMYFPSIGTLRSRYVPDSHRSVIMNLFGIPLNALVVSVFLSIQKLGLRGALSISSTALGLATISMCQLQRIANRIKNESGDPAVVSS